MNNKETKIPIIRLLHSKGDMVRLHYSIFGKLGDLFRNFDGPIAIPKGTNKIVAKDEDSGESQVYDRFINQWVPFTDSLLESIPPTFSYVPKPTNLDLEVDYFVRSAGLIKHAFVWSDSHEKEGIPWEQFCQIRGSRNIKYRGRFTLTPWLPRIEKMARMENGCYIVSEKDWKIIYGL